jgi:hypothetical protein
MRNGKVIECKVHGIGGRRKNYFVESKEGISSKGE